jgi:hypothetical protein
MFTSIVNIDKTPIKGTPGNMGEEVDLTPLN